MKNFLKWSKFAGILVGAALGAACATPQAIHNERKGFFATLGDPRRGPAHEARSRERNSLFGKKTGGAEGVGGNPKVSTELSKNLSLRWPLEKVEITSEYGKRGDGYHEGIDLRAKNGTPVYAAQSGTVIYSGRKVSGYGNLIVLRHKNGVATVYAHNSRNIVKKGQKVRKGQKIAYSGSTGRVSGPHLHFEVREGVDAVDPIQVLARPPSVLMASGGSRTEMGPIKEQGKKGRKPSSVSSQKNVKKSGQQKKRADASVTPASR